MSEHRVLNVTMLNVVLVVCTIILDHGLAWVIVRIPRVHGLCISETMYAPAPLADLWTFLRLLAGTDNLTIMIAL